VHLATKLANKSEKTGLIDW